MKKLLKFLVWLAGVAVFLLVTAHFTLQHLLNTPDFKKTMTGFIAQAFSGDVARGSVQFYSVFAVGLLLFFMTLAMNLLSHWVARRFREEYD